VEKPPVDQAPSNLAIIGRYVLSPLIFSSLEQIEPGAGGEIQLTDGIKHMMQHNPDHKVLAIKVQGTRHDLGTPQGWIRAMCDIASREGWMNLLFDTSIFIKNYSGHSEKAGLGSGT